MKKESVSKKKIKKYALDLFNEKDTFSITTNHIALCSKISTGNLYYHYKNKEDIIIDIYEEMIEKFENLNSFEKILNSQNHLEELSKMYDLYLDIFWDYRFLMRDSSVLLSTLPKFKEIFIQRQNLRIEQIKMLIEYFISKDIFKQMSEDEILLSAKLNWFISTYWQNFISINEVITKESFKEAKDVIFKININPFLK
ncbi:TetR/AcrR family transcriptional regulator [Aliarcobacter butzleri]|uniref:TetR/AcrR family transcriptional regulator n=1 Tax=Aliarcobacter butzleri TaxID=28197 RepID=UPI00125FDFA2|nr:TetR/AcrR family transcriptional regulator [Aliarcobacter butzleri]MCT7551090.1 TetR/AcrR family transcriptional regulator [Aliarcobacter butzleri]MCT7560056.1 TetR/AcrR family transcriptional regulator [Aliarcobacter butzleri]MCT7595721.1 TetR/AcrR family transcriptional regulator [Aliarcobacter butzleri]MCT7600225.1 TetR/AcrR family transcriptional regulator [Aliarcobacter butzleri]MCT7653544.1 TetR/AcrR family transcriptional regulator [Aliarcobacter butzleri]